MEQVHYLQHLAHEYGTLIYAIIFLWAFVEGETFVIFAGFVAHRGFLDWWGVFFAAWFGSFAGDQLYFWIGRKWGPKVLQRLPRWRSKVDIALEWLKKHNTGFILSFRFIYGVRNFASFAMGMSGLDPVRFAVLNFLAAFLWALAFAGAGYMFGRAVEQVFGDMIEQAYLFEIVGFVMLAIVVCAFSVTGLLLRRRRRTAGRIGATAMATATAVQKTPGQ